MQIAHLPIVVVAFNRPEALSRLLRSVASANYGNFTDIPLVISIDGGGNKNKDVQNIAHTFTWKYGEKEVITHPENLGLRNHIISCGDLLNKFERQIVLEEDCFVSPNYYDFAFKSLTFYNTEKKVAGISLYSYLYYESFGTVFTPLIDGYDTYFMQVPSSLGQIWTKEQWFGFKAWYNTNPEIGENDKIPEKVKTWPENSWKKYFYKYMVENDLFFVYPHIAFTTNFGDTGTHFPEKTQIYQVNIEYYEKGKSYNFPQFANSNNKYDSYFEILPQCLIKRGLKIDPDTCIDIMGSKPLHLFTNIYALSCKSYGQALQSFDDVLIPVIQNVLHQMEGNSIYYGLRQNFGKITQASRLRQISNAQSLGFSAGMRQVLTHKYYKIGFYLINFTKIPAMLKRKIIRKFSPAKKK
jgi:glycosyltransferase involved in cell wall biosynthesis